MERELYEKAIRQVNTRRQLAITKSITLHENTLQLIPKLKEIEDQILNSGIKATSLAITKAGSDKIEMQNKITAVLEEKKNQCLTENKLPTDYFEPKFSCTLCNDKGRVNGKLCKCVEKLVCEYRLENMNSASPLSISSFDTFSLEKYPNAMDNELNVNPRKVMENVYNNCLSYANNFKTNYPSLMLIGDSGLGKTHLALAIAGMVMEKGTEVIYVSAQNIFSQLEKEKFQSNDKLNSLLDAPLLILDDLGTEYLTSYIHSCLYNIVNTRMLAKRPTIFTSNITDENSLRARYTEKIASRLLGGCVVLQFFGNDIRINN